MIAAFIATDRCRNTLARVNEHGLSRKHQSASDRPPRGHGAGNGRRPDRSRLSELQRGRLREICQVFTRKFLEPDCTVGLTHLRRLTPAGLGMSCLIPLIEAGFIDWIVSTGANLYHDTHFALDMPLHQCRPNLDDFALRQNDVIRIYDIVFDYETLLDTDASTAS